MHSEVKCIVSITKYKVSMQERYHVVHMTALNFRHYHFDLSWIFALRSGMRFDKLEIWYENIVYCIERSIKYTNI